MGDETTNLFGNSSQPLVFDGFNTGDNYLDYGLAALTIGVSYGIAKATGSSNTNAALVAGTVGLAMTNKFNPVDSVSNWYTEWTKPSPEEQLMKDTLADKNASDSEKRNAAWYLSTKSGNGNSSIAGQTIAGIGTALINKRATDSQNDAANARQEDQQLHEKELLATERENFEKDHNPADRLLPGVGGKPGAVPGVKPVTGVAGTGMYKAGDITTANANVAGRYAEYADSVSQQRQAGKI